MNEIENIFEKPFDLPIRIVLNPKSGLNIVPCDFDAKVMYHVVTENIKDRNFFLANNEETPHSTYIRVILDSLNIKGWSLVDKEPDDQNELEVFHYKTVGKVFAPYTTSDPILFDISNLSSTLKKNNLTCPPVDNKNMATLIDYAKRKHFGLAAKNAHQ